MKTFINLCSTIIFTLTLTGFVLAQEKPAIPQVPKGIPKPIPSNTSTTENVEDAIKTQNEKYDVPFIEKEKLKEGKTKLTAEIEQLTAEALVEASDDGTTKLKISMSNVNKIAKDKTIFVWLMTGEGKYTKIGEVIHSETSANAEMKGQTPINKFGIFITVEDGKVDKPTSKTYVAFR